MSADGARWAIVVPVKRLDVAKTRLSSDARVRSDLALAMAQDTVRAALECAVVDVVVVVTDEPAAAEVMRTLGASVVADTPDAGLNPALAHGAEQARRQRPGTGVAAIASDLPALRSRSLEQVLRAADVGRAVVGDAAGTGTTVFAAAGDAAFRPRFGDNSRAAHVAEGAADLTAEAPADVRRDVDTLDDLRTAVALGCGPATSAAARHHRLLQ